MAKPKPRKAYVVFREVDPAPKTRRWVVLSLDEQHTLGWISFRGAWRKYVFSAAAGSIFEWWCLVDIAKFCKRRTLEHWAVVQDSKA